MYNGEPYKSDNIAVGFADPYMPSIHDMPNIEVVQEQSWNLNNPKKSRWQPPQQQNNAPANTPQNPYQQNNTPQYYYQNQVNPNNQLQANNQQRGISQFYQNNNNMSPYAQNNASQTNAKTGFARVWWLFLLALILPFPAGLIFFSVLGKSSDDSVKKLAFPMLGLAVLKIVVFLAGLF